MKKPSSSLSSLIKEPIFKETDNVSAINNRFHMEMANLTNNPYRYQTDRIPY